MDDKAKAKVIEALRDKDAPKEFGTCYYLDTENEGKRCVLGYLAHKAGVDDGDLIAAGRLVIGHHTGGQESTPLSTITKALEGHYGLSVLDMFKIQCENDEQEPPTPEGIIEFIEKRWDEDR